MSHNLKFNAIESAIANAMAFKDWRFVIRDPEGARYFVVTNLDLETHYIGSEVLVTVDPNGQIDDGDEYDYSDESIG